MNVHAYRQRAICLEPPGARDLKNILVIGSRKRENIERRACRTFVSNNVATLFVVSKRTVFYAVTTCRPGNAQIPETVAGPARERGTRTLLISRTLFVRIVVFPTVARSTVAHEKPTDAFTARPTLKIIVGRVTIDCETIFKYI